MSFRDHFVHDPSSAVIAAELNAKGATECEHRWNPCTLRCGVRAPVKRLPDTVTRDGDNTTWTANYELLGPWVVEAYEARVAWLERVEENIARETIKRVAQTTTEGP